MSSTLLDRFCRYVRVDTQANESAGNYPSSPGQMELGRMLAAELESLKLSDVCQDEYGIVTATVPATISRDVPAIAWIAHLDTSPETSGHNVKPMIHHNYDGRDIVLPGDPTKVICIADNPDLAPWKGATIITTDGTTLLGADNKAGVAVIIEAAAYLVAHPDIPHGPIRVCFTCDEEIGHGVDHVDLKKLGALVGYTLDGGGHGEIDVETFSADLAVVTIAGVNIHPAIAKGRMVNAIRLAGLLLERLPRQALAPEVTDGRDGFLHPYRIEGGVAEVTLRILLRDFETPKLAEKAELLRNVARRSGGGVSAGAHRREGHAAISQHGRGIGEGAAGRGLCRRGDAASRAGAEDDNCPRRHRRLAADRIGSADAEPVDGRAQFAFAAGMDLFGRDADGGEGARGAGAGVDAITPLAVSRGEDSANCQNPLHAKPQAEVRSPPIPSPLQ